MPAAKKSSKVAVAAEPAKLNPDLENERKTCSFDVEELARWWNGGEQKLLEKRTRGEKNAGRPAQRHNVTRVRSI